MYKQALIDWQYHDEYGYSGKKELAALRKLARAITSFDDAILVYNISISATCESTDVRKSAIEMACTHAKGFEESIKALSISTYGTPLYYKAQEKAFKYAKTDNEINNISKIVHRKEKANEQI